MLVAGVGDGSMSRDKHWQALDRAVAARAAAVYICITRTPCAYTGLHGRHCDYADIVRILCQDYKFMVKTKL